MWWLLIAACGYDRSDAKNVATILCRWGQLEELTPEVLPDDVDLDKMVRQADLQFAHKEPSRRASVENPFLAMQQTVGMVAEEPARALAEAVAEKVSCELTGTVEGDRAQFHIVRKVPRPLRDQDSVARAAELDALGSRAERVARVRTWIADAEIEELDYDLILVRRGEAWVANFELPEKARGAAKTELDKVLADIARMEKDQLEIDKLEVVRTEYFAKTATRANPRVDIVARNGLDMRVGKIEFHGVLRSPDREEPWVDDPLTHVPLGRFEPGKEDTFTIVSRLPARWRTLAPEGSTLSLKVTRIAGPSGQWKYDVSGWDDAVVRRSELEAEIARIDSVYLAEPN